MMGIRRRRNAAIEAGRFEGDERYRAKKSGGSMTRARAQRLGKISAALRHCRLPPPFYAYRRRRRSRGAGLLPVISWLLATSR